MRPYRGKRKDNNEWVYGHLMSPDRIMVWDKEVCMRSESYLVISSTVGQSTGLKDKNGKEIYEGDILDDCWAVRFFDAHYLLCNPIDEPASQCAKEELDGDVVAHSEIIGNIHDNLELLKGDK